uniref:Uncharacterized protein n=1 Tax=Enterovibrio sp. FF_113 TaxID=1660266 RepID=A0A0H3ZZD0_9GAMM|nr:hypothetical protein [Enterovibrio sp. FF_113]
MKQIYNIKNRYSITALLPILARWRAQAARTGRNTPKLTD